MFYKAKGILCKIVLTEGKTKTLDGNKASVKKDTKAKSKTKKVKYEDLGEQDLKGKKEKIHLYGVSI